MAKGSDGDRIAVDVIHIDCGSLIKALKWLRRNRRKYTDLWKDVEQALDRIQAEKADAEKGGQ